MGALERQPYFRVQNLARAMEEVADLGYRRIGLAGDAEAALDSVLAITPGPVALVLGAEGSGGWDVGQPVAGRALPNSLPI